MPGDVKDATPNTNPLPEHFTVVIISAEGVKIPASTQKTVLRYVTAAINSGGTATLEMITPDTWSNVWGNRDLRGFRSGPTNTGKKTTS
jgi:hypothetical protein